jgi:hypothetical protein
MHNERVHRHQTVQTADSTMGASPRATPAARAIYRSVKPNDLHDVVQALLASAKGGDVSAARELFQRVLGPPEAIDLIDRMEALEQKLTEIAEQRSRP